MKKVIVLVASAVLAFGLSACGSKETSATTSASVAPTTSAAASAGGTVDLKIVAIEGQKFEKTEYKVKVGQSVNLSLENKNGNHAFSIKGLDVKVDASAGKTVTFDKAGEYEVICTIPCGQNHMKMKTKIIVEA